MKKSSKETREWDLGGRIECHSRTTNGAEVWWINFNKEKFEAEKEFILKEIWKREM